MPVIGARVSGRQWAWSLGKCPFCRTESVIRIEEAIQTIYINFVPVIRSKIGCMCRCDLCKRLLTEELPEFYAVRDAWRPSDGIPSLAAQLGVDDTVIEPYGDIQRRSVLSAATESSEIAAMGIVSGLTLGCLLGALAGGMIGYFFLNGRLRGVDWLASVFFGLFGGLVLGGVSGASLAAVWNRRAIPFKLIHAAISEYHMDADKFVECAQTYPTRIRRAAERARDVELLAAVR